MKLVLFFAALLAALIFTGVLSILDAFVDYDPDKD
jgi:hypothetical protein